MVCMPEIPLQNLARPRIGVFCDQQFDSELAINLKQHNSQWIASSFPAVQCNLSEQPVDIVLCFISDPHVAASAWIRTISAMPDLFVIVIVSEVGIESCKILLEAGAERCLSLPISDQYLGANILKTYQHLQRLRNNKINTKGIANKSWQLNCQQWQLVAPSGVCMAVTKLEMRFLQILMAADGELIPRMQLASKLYINREEHEFQRMEMLISRLRKKARLHLHQELPIKTSYADGLAFIAASQISQA